MNKKISVVIVTHNSEAHIYACLEALFTYNDIGNALEVIVVDNNSAEADAMFLTIESHYDDKVKLIKNTINGGYGQGNNVGIKAATAPYILIMNPDVRLTEPIFKKGLATFETIDNVVVVGMKQLTNKLAQGLSISWTIFSPALLRIPATLLLNKFNCYISRYMYITGACFFLDKKKFEKIGLFDEDIFMYGEEDDIRIRFKNENIENKIIYLRKVSFLHLCGDRILKINSLQNVFKSNIYLYRKYGKDLSLCYKREIDRMKLLIAKEKIRHLFSESPNCLIFKEWKKQLEAK